MSLWYALVDLLPFEWAVPGEMYFMKHALLAVLVITPLFGLLSTMVVHSRMSFFSDALGHSAFTGMAIGALCGFHEPTWAAVAFAILFALLFNVVKRRSALAGGSLQQRLVEALERFGESRVALALESGAGHGPLRKLSRRRLLPGLLGRLQKRRLPAHRIPDLLTQSSSHHIKTKPRAPRSARSSF